MPTKYDVFAELIEKAPSSAKDLSFKKPIYSHLKTLVKLGYVKKEKNLYIPIKNSKSQKLFSIIKYCLKNGLDYNILLSKNISLILSELIKNIPNIRPKSLQGNKEYTKLLHYLENNQFILLFNKRPRRGILLNHQLLVYLKEFYDLQFNFKKIKLYDLQKEVLQLRPMELNPFDNKVFEFLSGSAQLEGSTVTVGETKELLLNDIYPDKPKKDIQMIKNLNEAIYYISEHLFEDITPDHIKEINKLVLFSLHRNAGKYKTTPNKIQGNIYFKTASPEKVSVLMDNYCKKLKTIDSKEKCVEELGYIHNELQYIHPFSDGNSRTTRMILNWMLLKNKLPLLVIKMGCFDEYMTLTKLSKHRDDNKLKKLFYHILIHESLLN